MDNSNFQYDAFISYRHIPRDMAIAKKLHSALETYRTPKKMVKNGFPPRISRVFRDREELPTSSDLSCDIENALKNSRFLIVICSPEAVASMWVLKEVEIFAGFHGYDRIITLLVEGEPKDSFPPGIIRYLYNENGDIEKVIEPLAADIRKRDGKNPVTLLKEEKLRLIATIIGCKYDELKQREHERKIKKIISTSIAIGSTLAIFSLIFLIQLYQVTAAKNLAQKNKSSLLAYVAMSQINNGDKINGMLLALEAYESNGVKNTAFNVETALYNSAMTKDFQYRTLIKSNDKIDKGCLDTNEDYLLVKTGLNAVKIYDSMNGGLLGTFDAGKYYSGFFSETIAYVTDIIPNSNDAIIKISDQKFKKNKYVLYDVINKKELCFLQGNEDDKHFYQGYDSDSANQLKVPLFCYSVYDPSDKSAVNKEVYIVNTLSGKLLNSISVPSNAFCTIINENIMAVNSGSSLTLFSISTGKPTQSFSFQTDTIDNISACSARYISFHTTKKELIVFDTTNGKTLFSLSNAELYNTAFDNKDEKAAILYSDNKSAMKLAVYSLKNGSKLCESQTAYNNCNTILFTPDDLKIVVGGRSSFVSYISQFNSENALNIVSTRVIPLISFKITKDGDRLITFFTDNTLGIIDLTANELLNAKLNSLGNIQKISPDKKLLIGTSGNSICSIDTKSGKVLRFLKGHTDYINFIDFSNDGEKIISSSYDGTVRIWDVSAGNQLSIVKTSTSVYSAKLSRDNKLVVTINKDSLSVWDANTGLKIRQLEGKVDAGTVDAEDMNHFDDYAEFNPDGTKIISKRGDEVKVWDSNTGKVLFNNNVDIIQKNNISQVMFSPDGSQFFICKPFQIDIYDANGYIYENMFYNFDSVYALGTLVFSDDGKKIAFSTASATTYVWGIDRSKFLRTKLLSTIYGSGTHSSLAFVSDSKRIFILNNNGLTLFDIDKNAYLCQTGTSYNPNVKMRPAVFLLSNDRIMAVENFDIQSVIRVWPIFNNIDELVKYVKTKVGNRKIDEDFYSKLSENTY